MPAVHDCSFRVCAGSSEPGEEFEHQLPAPAVGAGEVPAGLGAVLAELLGGQVLPAAVFHGHASEARTEGGEGQFESATGFVASTFTIGDDGDLSEYHCGMIFLPE